MRPNLNAWYICKQVLARYVLHRLVTALDLVLLTMLCCLCIINECGGLSPFTYVVCCAYLMLDLTHLVHRPVRRSTQHGLCGNMGLIAVRSSGTYTLIASWVFGVLIEPFYLIVVTEITSILDLPRGKETCGLHT
jgi:hypothetical protein